MVASYLTNRNQFVLINGFNLALADTFSGVSEVSIFCPLLFLVYINDLHHAIKYSKVHHFADDTNLMNFQASIKMINKKVNHDLKNLSNWLLTKLFFMSVKRNLFCLVHLKTAWSWTENKA